MARSEAIALLEDLTKRGIEIQAQGTRLRFRPKGSVPADVVAEITRCKPDLLAALSDLPANRELIAKQYRERAAERMAARMITLAVPLRNLPALLAWIGDFHLGLFRRQEAIGIELACAWDGYVGARVDEKRFRRALALWGLKIREGSNLYLGSFDAFMGRAPIWAFWTCYTLQGCSETGFSRFLRESIGYPTDEEAGISSGDGGSHE